MISDRLHLRLFLDGIEIPVISAMTQFSLGSPEMATIELIPTPMSKYVRPRTTVHIFYYDDFSTFDDEDMNYKLVFFGEVTGKALNRTSSATAAAYTCLGQTNHWMRAQYSYVSHPDPNMFYVADKLRAIFGNSDSITPVPNSNFENYAIALMRQGAEEGKQRISYENWLAKTDTVFNYDMGSSGEYLDGIKKLISHLATMNTYYASKYYCLRTGNSLGIPENDVSASNLLSFDAYIRIMEKATSSLGETATLQDLIALLLGKINYTMLSVACPPLMKDRGRLYTNLILPELWFAAPPRCNVIFPDDYQSIDYTRDFLQDLTRQVTFADHTLPGLEGSILDKYYWAVFSPSHIYPSELSAETLVPSGEVGNHTSYDSWMAQQQGAENARSDPDTRFNELLKVYPHERHTGPVARYTNIPNIITYLTPSTTNVTPETVDTMNREEHAQYLRRVADHGFYKGRFAARNVTLPCRFKPSLTPGFTALVLVPTPGVPVMGDTGCHLIGYVTNVTHVMNQSGGSTQVGLSYLREYDETLDLFSSEELTTRGAPLEQLLTPGWLSSIYSSVAGDLDDCPIGTHIYQKFLGVGSLLEKSKISFTAEKHALWEDYSNNFRALKHEGVVLATDKLYLTYMAALETRSDIGRFIHDFTHRPGATLPEVIGEGGFHTGYAFYAPAGDDKLAEAPYLQTGALKDSGSWADPRKERQDWAKAYVNELLSFGRGLRL